MDKWSVIKEKVKYFFEDWYIYALSGAIIAFMIFGIPAFIEDMKNNEEMTETETQTEVELEKRTEHTLTTTTEEVTSEEPEPELVIYRRQVTDEEYQLLVRVVMSEAGGRYGEPMEGKVAVVETILNRVDMGYGSIAEVVASAYSTADNGAPDESCVEAVEIALTGEDDYPDNMLFFRAGTYHSFGTPYKQIGNHYFSLLE